MIETIALSTAVFFSVYSGCPTPSKQEMEMYAVRGASITCAGNRCEAFQEVVKKEYRGDCDKEENKTSHAKGVNCNKDGLCYELKVTPPLCLLTTISTRLVGMCGDGIVRWSEVKK